MKRATLTVAICAYNEGKNIEKFLKSVLMQEEEGFILEKILVISDGSKDDTIKKAKSIKSSKIEIRKHYERVGKSSRLNEIYSSLTSDILVQTDSDVIFAHPYVIRDIIQPIIKDKKVGMCGGNPIPLKGETFTERAVNATCEIYLNFRKTVRGGNNKFSADGRLLAYKKELVKNIIVPYDMIANDVYTYFSCLEQGYKYRFVESAVVHYRSPQILKDQIRQNSRFLAAPIRMKKYFPKDLVEKENEIPSGILLKETFRQFLRHPILCSYIYIINRYCKFKAMLIEKQMTAKWEIALTTKELNRQA